MNAPDINSTELSLERKTARLGHLIHRYYQAVAHEKGLAGGDPTRGQGRVLALLTAKPETTQRELSYLLDMRQQSLSELLSKLEEKGYVTRERSDGDKRVITVRLTEEGAAAAPDLSALDEREDVIDCLDEDERKRYEELVDKISANVAAKLEKKGIDPHALKRGPHHGPHGPHGPKGCRPDGPHGPHMMHRA